MQYFLYNITMCYTEKKKNVRVCHAQDVNLRTSRNSYVTCTDTREYRMPRLAASDGGQGRTALLDNGRRVGQRAWSFTTYGFCGVEYRRERLSSPRSMLRYVILLNIHNGNRLQLPRCMNVVLWPLAADFCFTQPAVLQLFPRYSVDIYKCTNASELISVSRSPCGLQELWTTPVHVHIAIASYPIPANKPVSL